MIDFIEYVVAELKSKRLSKTNALSLIKQFSFNSASNARTSTIHPLLHVNTSDLGEQSYSSTFSGEEFFLADHQIKTADAEPGKKVLPGVAYLEMARAALENAIPASEVSGVLELHNTIWAHPIVVADDKEVGIALMANDDGQIDYEIYSQENDNETIHCQGHAVFSHEHAITALDIAQLKAQMQRGTLNAAGVYEAFNKLGLQYGPSHQGISTIYQGEKQLLAQLRLPKIVETSQTEFLLHPSLMDSALQASIGLVDDLTGDTKPSVPFALESLRIIAACTKDMYAWVRYSPGSQPGDNVVKLDIDLCDQDGTVCAQLRGFTSRVLGAESRSDKKHNVSALTSSVASKNYNDLLIATPVWESRPLSVSTAPQSSVQQHHIILVEMPNVDASQLSAIIPKGKCVQLNGTENNIAERYTEISLTCFDILQNILKSKPQDKVIVQLVIANNQEKSLFLGLSPLLKTAALENPKLLTQTILASADVTSEELSKILQQDALQANDAIIKYDGNARYVQNWIDTTSANRIGSETKIDSLESTYNIPFKNHGVYVITGGLGGLGVLFGQEIIKQTTKAKIIFTGRSELTTEKQTALDGLSKLGGQLAYKQLDLSSQQQVEQCIAEIIKEYGQLNGVIHSAGMTVDNFILKKTPAEFNNVLNPKVTGTFNLDRACQAIDLDFLVLFSSGVAALGNVGQADYAAANGFMDQFAAYRNKLVDAKQRHGKTLSINWPLWHAGGMSLDDASKALLQSTTGMQPMETATGMQAFYLSLALTANQTLVMEGNLAKMRRLLWPEQLTQAEPVVPVVFAVSPVSVATASTVPVRAESSGNLIEQTQNYLRAQFSDVLKLPAHQIDPQASLENYGINSILAMNLTGQLENTFGNLSKTLLFEYLTIHELTGYFIESFPEKLASLFASDNAKEIAVRQNNQTTSVVKHSETLPQNFTKPALNSGRRFSRQHALLNTKNPANTSMRSSASADLVAVIGLSGRYPEATNIQEYWTNLRDGKDCITEIPTSRWNWQEYFTEDRDQEGHYSKWGGFIAGVDEFDPKFFNISPREAEYIDPQERLFLQHAWMAVEDAGYTRNGLQISREQGLAGQVGVYVGVMYGEYNLSGSLASIANRVSYVLNLHGPSMTLDTMCSSSLTAIHLACQDLKSGRTDLGIAGGVNISIHPNKYSMLSAGQFISGDGHCQSFGEGGDGYIPGEGVGAVILKRLSEAEQDGDHIYGVIRGSSLNHGGKTNGYTVPNPQAQAGAISQALVESNTNPRHVSYIEAHGTGTKLGDPIEIAALSKAFYQNSSNKEFGFCLLGSAKSNIGHCESAAGIAGLTKVLLQMKHQQIVPSLHSVKLNPHIDFEKTPFIVNQSLRAWDQPIVDGKQCSRIAGLSSFGAGGSNAHIILEEYVPSKNVNQWNNSQPIAQVIIPLSARTTEQLQQKVRDLLDFIRADAQENQSKETANSIDLAAMAFTLQIGREGMEERLGFLVNSVDQLVEKLEAYIQAEQKGADIRIADVYRGQVKGNKDTLSLFSDDTDLQDTIDKWIAQKKLPKLLELWVKGLDLDWKKLHEGNPLAADSNDIKPQRISLPTYPFAKEKYWIDAVERGLVTITPAAVTPLISQVVPASVSALHPLLHTNTSDLSEQSYSSFFTGHEFFFSNEKQNDSHAGDNNLNQKVVPPVIYLEMARAAVAQATPVRDSSNVLELRNIAWGQPMVVAGNKQITIALFANDGSEHIDYEIYSRDKSVTGDIQEVVHCQGQAIYSQHPSPVKLGIATLQAQLRQGKSPHPGITSLYKDNEQLLATVNLSKLLEESHLEQNKSGSGLGDYILHPSVMDCVLQMSAALVIDTGRFASQPFAFSLASISVIFACLNDMVISVRYAQRSSAEDANGSSANLDIDLCDLQGNVCVQMRGLLLRQIDVNQQALVKQESIKHDHVKLSAPIASLISRSVVVTKPKSVQLVNVENVDTVKTAATAVTKPQSARLPSAQLIGTQEIVATPVPLTVAPAIATIGGDLQPHNEVEITLTREQLEQQLRASLAEALYLKTSDIDNDKSFVDLGLDSIVGVEWVKVINKKYGLAISATRVYDYSSIVLLAEFLEKEIEKLPTSFKQVAPVVVAIAASPIATTTSSSINSVQHNEPEVIITRDQLQQQLRVSLAEALYLKTSDIDNEKSFVDLGLDSIVGVEWVKVINKKYGLAISATRVYDYSNINQLAEYLESEIKKLPLSDSKLIAVEPPVKAIPQQLETYQQPPALNNNYLSSGLLSYPNLKRKSRVSRAVSYNAKDSQHQEPLPLANNTPAQDKVAIIGMSGRYPQASNLQEYWDNLIAGKNSIAEIPPSRWDVNQYYDQDPTKKGKVYCKWLGMLDDIDCFDPLFFQISPAEAESMDPQHRLFMQEGYRAFEDAGYSNKSLGNKKCGVYLGIMSSEYSLLLSKVNSTSVDTTGNSFAIGSARISYYLNLKGPAIPIDTACSSSLVGIHLASQALLNHEIDMALTGGVSLYLTAESYLGMCQAGMLSPEGQCKAFDDSANGFVPGEGVGALVLKRLKDAQADNDFIYGVILGSGINQDGKTNGITAPSVNSQIELEREIYTKYNIHPETISYVETHGTGTKLGDPIELEALGTVFGEKTSKKNYCALGSVKSNIGHTSGAAGVASVQKVLLSMRHKQLVPSLNVVKENAFFDFENSPFYISRKTQPWQAGENSLRRASVSAFGFSGTNAHLVIEEYVAPEAVQASVGPNADVTILLSARTAEQLQQRAHDLLDYVRKESSTGRINLTSIAYTLQTGREAMKERMGIIVNSIEQLVEKLQAYIADTPDIEGLYQGQVTRDKDTLSLFSTDADLRETVDKWIARKNLSKLLDLWVKGLDVDWNKFYGDKTPQRIGLPTYPFAKEKYWINSDELPITYTHTSVLEGITETMHGTEEEKQKMFFSPHWKISPSTASAEHTAMTGPILILDKTDTLFLSLKKSHGDSLEENSIVWVKLGDTYEELEPTIFTINPEREDHFHQLVENLKAQGQLPRHIIHQGVDSGNLWRLKGHQKKEYFSEQLQYGLYTLVYLCKALMTQKHPVPLQILSTFTRSSKIAAPQNEALGAFFKTLSLENPKYLTKVLEIQNDSDDEELFHSEKANLILNEFQDKNWDITEIRYKQSKDKLSHTRYIKEFTAYNPDDRKISELPLKQNGVYIITGGLGGLGFIFSEYLVKNFQAKLVLLGRSALREEQEEKLEQLKAYNSEIVYLQADVSKLEEVESAVSAAKAQFSNINGVIHIAGVNRDSFILKKTTEEIEDVLDPKIYGTINLDQATSAENLDLFVLFSSIAGAMGNLGQCDYAYANHFLDSFAESREVLRKKQKRFGKTLSINWPFWEEGGMTISPNDIALTEKQTGMCPLPTAEGIQYWEEFLRSDLSQGVALYGTPGKIESYVGHDVLNIDKNKLTLAKTIDPAILLEKTEIYLKGLISEEIKLAPERIDSDERFESFGIDSIMIGRFNVNLERDLGALPKTLLYEYETIHELANYLVQDAEQALIIFFNMESSTAEFLQQVNEAQLIKVDVERALEDIQTDKKIDNSEPIAIIGVHGYYPHSNDLDEYWENLKSGKDLIDLVPSSRWDHEEYFHSDPAKAVDGKIYCKWGGFLDDFDKFDPAFFNITAEEAKIIDPQERIFLGSVWAVIEDAGYTRESLKKNFPKAKSADVGVFVGVTTNSYQLLASEEWSRGNIISPTALPWSIANRVSYFFDFQGPSMPVDTACSSSLVAIHLACESLKNQECQVAIAGGVNLYLHPSKYHSFCQKRMLAVGGKNHSFGAGDDGFIPGEGVGTVLLKPLSKAIAHHDHIYAVIPGSAFDHSGRSNGYSIPNPNSQAALIAHTLKKARMHPESIGYIEGHGTGTQLGDSIEIAALTQVFEKQTSKKQFCPIGSVKANIGHSESAAGIAGITKILMQIKHKQLVPTIYSDEVNPNIEFEGSPFYLQHKLTPWKPSAHHPRRALINSFGAGGVNACVILEEYETSGVPEQPPIAGPFLVVLSAKNELRLQEYVNRMIHCLEKDEDIDLADFSYTLQTGREGMQERLAIITRDREDLIGQLTSLNAQPATVKQRDIYRGSLDPRKGAKKSHKSVGDDSLTAVFESKNLATLAGMWVAGEQIEWEKLYTDSKPARISLPTYPFAKERYWVSDALIPHKRSTLKPKNAQLHPLISYNSSTLKEVSFSSLLSTDEFYSQDHKINDENIFPGAGFLEIACVAGSIAGEQKVSKIRDIVWIQPLSFRSGSQMVRTFLKSIGNSTEYEITSLDEDNERVVHSEGRILFHDDKRDTVDTSPAPLQIKALKEQCSKPQDGSEYYKNFKTFGFHYGTSFQTIQEYYGNESFALSKLKISDHLKNEFDQFVLHPSIIDGALQTVVGLIGSVESGIPYLPFAVDEVELVRPMTNTCYAYVERADFERQAQAGIKKFNIQLVNENGEVLVRLNNFYVRALEQVQGNQHSDARGYDITVD